MLMAICLRYFGFLILSVHSGTFETLRSKYFESNIFSAVGTTIQSTPVLTAPPITKPHTNHIPLHIYESFSLSLWTGFNNALLQ